MKKTILITGVTGMIGEAVLYESLQHPEIEKVIAITRKPSGYRHDKLTEIIHANLSNISSVKNSLADCDACFFCVGTSALGKSEEQYTAENYTMPLNFARTLVEINPQMSFCYISGVGTDSTEQGRTMWARVKGRTENDLLKLSFAQVYNFRPPALIPFLPVRRSQTYYSMYKYGKWLFQLLRPLFPNYILDMRTLASALINTTFTNYPKQVLEPRDIRKLAKTG